MADLIVKELFERGGEALALRDGAVGVVGEVGRVDEAGVDILAGVFAVFVVVAIGLGLCWAIFAAIFVEIDLGGLLGRYKMEKKLFYLLFIKGKKLGTKGKLSLKLKS